MPNYASFVYCTLGIAYYSLSDNSKAIAYDTEHLKMAMEVGDRSGAGGQGVREPRQRVFFAGEL